MRSTIQLTEKQRLLEIVLPDGQHVYIQALVTKKGLKLGIDDGSELCISDEDGSESFFHDITIEIIP